jgi:hypothetical protein
MAFVFCAIAITIVITIITLANNNKEKGGLMGVKGISKYGWSAFR